MSYSLLPTLRRFIMAQHYFLIYMIMLGGTSRFLVLGLRNQSWLILPNMSYINIKRGITPTQFQSPSIEKILPCPISRRYRLYLIKSNQLLVTLYFSHRNHRHPLTLEISSLVTIILTGSMDSLINMVLKTRKFFSNMPLPIEDTPTD